MADISICPAIRMPPSFRGVSSVALGAVAPCRTRTDIHPIPGLLFLLSYKDIYPSSGYVAGSTAFPACRGPSPFRVKETETALAVLTRTAWAWGPTRLAPRRAGRKGGARYSCRHGAGRLLRWQQAHALSLCHDIILGP